jgi:hypothetical protein
VWFDLGKDLARTRQMYGSAYSSLCDALADDDADDNESAKDVARSPFPVIFCAYY